MWRAAGLMAAGAGLLLRSSYERRTLTTSVYELESDKIKRNRTFVFLSDLHDNCFGEGQKELLQEIDRIHPEAVLIGGDMMVVKKRAETATALFLVKKLAADYLVYYGNGNHENRMDRGRGIYGDQYDQYVKALVSLGVRHLSDQSALCGEDVQVSGVNLDYRYYKKGCKATLEAGYIEDKLGRPDPRKFQILLAHSPLFHEAYAHWGADLALSGHFHGGTIRLPVFGGVVTPQLQFFNPYCGGIFYRENRAMIVSRGLGTHSVNIRLNNKPELVVIRVRPGGRIISMHKGHLL